MPRFVLDERVKHALIALAIALVAGFLTLLRPLDITAWALQARLFEREASGEFVYVRMPTPTEDVALTNRTVLHTVENLRAAGAGRIFINIPLRRSGSADTDERLRAFISANSNSVFLTNSVEQDYKDSDRLPPTSPYFMQQARVFGSDYDADFLRFVWGFQLSRDQKDNRRPLPLSYALSDTGSARDIVLIDYAIRADTIPELEFDAVTDSLNGVDVTGKTFVLGTDSFGVGIRAPGADTVSPTIVHILAAETLRRGSGQSLPWITITLALGIALALGVRLIQTRRRRRLFYLAWCGAGLTIFVATAYLGVRGVFADSLLLALSYAIMRSVARYRRRHLTLDPLTKLPNFAALKSDLSGGEAGGSACLVIAKVARLDALFVGLSPPERRLYLREICNRLALGDQHRAVYYDGGKYFAFMCDSGNIPDLQGHLEGLRAIASQPVRLGSKSLDVAVTMGADGSAEGAIEQRLSSAIAAADQAREAYKPVFLVGHDKDDWDHSLTAKLTQALAEDQIGIKLQPQVDLASGSFVGAEVLARWRDADGVDVPPSSFILQCERMGRLDSLTRRIFQKSFAAVEAIQQEGFCPGIAINVSAVQLVDDRIVHIANEALHEHPIDPAQVKIELTETARIEDFSIARGVVDRLKEFGFKLSLDDFGVGAANYEAWIELPFDEVKIDRRFIAGIEESPRARAIVSGIVHSAREAGITVLGEGIEDRATYDLLAGLGCNHGQGYYIARPLWLAEYIATLKGERDSAVFPQEYG